MNLLEKYTDKQLQQLLDYSIQIEEYEAAQMCKNEQVRRHNIKSMALLNTLLSKYGDDYSIELIEQKP